MLWVAPVVTAALLGHHARLHAALSGLAGHPHYRPGAWVPHVTLSGDGSLSPAAALGALLPRWTGPLDGKADAVELVRLHPVEVLWRRALPAVGKAAPA